MSSESNQNFRGNRNSDVFNSNPNRSLFFRDLPYSIRSFDLRKECERAGFVVDDAHVVVNSDKKTLQYGYVLFHSEEGCLQAKEYFTRNKRVRGRDIRVYDFNRDSNAESSKDGKVMVSFKCHQKLPLITEQTLRDVFEEQFNHPLTSVSIRKHQQTNGGQFGFGFISFGDDALDNQVVTTIKKIDIHNISFDCERTRTNADQSPDMQQSTVSSASSARAEETDGAVSNDSPATSTGSGSLSPMGKSPRANVVRRSNTTNSNGIAAGVSAHAAHNLRPSRRPNGQSIRNRTSGLTRRLQEDEEVPANNGEEESFPSFTAKSPSVTAQPAPPLQQHQIPIHPPPQQVQQQQTQQQPFVTNWSTGSHVQSPPTPLNTYTHVPMALTGPPPALGAAYTASPPMYYTVTSPSVTFSVPTGYMNSPGYSLTTPGNLIPNQPHHLPIQPPQANRYTHPTHTSVQNPAQQTQSYSQPQTYSNAVNTMIVPSGRPITVGYDATGMYAAGSTHSHPSGTSHGTGTGTALSKVEYVSNDTHQRYIQQGMSHSRLNRSSSADECPPTPGTAVGSYMMSPSDTFSDRASFSSPASMDAYNSFRPTPPLTYATVPQQYHHTHHPHAVMLQQHPQQQQQQHILVPANTVPNTHIATVPSHHIPPQNNLQRQTPQQHMHHSQQQHRQLLHHHYPSNVSVPTSFSMPSGYTAYHQNL